MAIDPKVKDGAHMVYQVIEKVDGEDLWYNHGGEFDNLKDAMNTMLRMQDTYSKYGRVFDVRYRSVGDWVMI